VSLSATAPNIGKVAAGTSATSFTVNAASGAVSIGTGGAQFVPYNATRTALTTITINCTGGSKCSTNNITVTLSAVSATNRMGTVSAWSADFTGAATARLNSGATSQTSATSTMTMTLKPVVTSGNSGSATFHLGLTVPVNTSGTLGGATSTYSVQASGTGYTAGTGSAAVQSTVEGKLSITSVTNLSFGQVFLVRDGTGAITSGTLTWDAATHAFTASPAGLVEQRGTGSIGKISVSGTPGQTLHFSLSGPGMPTQLTLTSPQGRTVALTPSTTGQSSQTIPSGGATPGVFDFYFGGTINIGATVATGIFGATITVVVNYE
jgi:hypothetical protein